jgi:hypothetical protein
MQCCLWVKKQNFKKTRIRVSSEIPVCRCSISSLSPFRILAQGGRQVGQQVVNHLSFCFCLL